MKDIPENYKFLSSHEWAKLEEDGKVTVGISDYAQDQLGDIVFVELPEIDSEVNQGDEAAVVESVKAASEVYSPVSGKVIDVNSSLEDSPETVNLSAFEEGWFFKIEVTDISELENLLSPEQYSEHCQD
ncbi:MAG TPA: glycine cleavage system protein GcvH [Gammaproteobacteria bacterium]|jgi:glycine cleavage system H protein|nr:glycine cleavage system protein GcvH [Gammaproteobacteria bacterium]HIA43957.1 glycine cleavage system protein GcvH [Gammaproteobacteria bacterium]HIA95354.1 glycine cleavage system protein GcvH [Gammaproteobacteria bacterium]HIB75188.1 glycine cleavage system protein GcvH [Gammaproteobacteria bacterium]HIG49378.1 glycine cleavage system protein GcvH [Gammaproteobacteria bacterium]